MVNVRKKILVELLEQKKRDNNGNEMKLYINEIVVAHGGMIKWVYSQVGTYTTGAKKSPFREACEAVGLERIGVYKGNEQLDNTDEFDLNNCSDVYVLLRVHRA